MSHRGYPITRQVREFRRKSAEERNAAYNAKYPTPQAKLAALPLTGCDKQRRKLERQIEEQKSGNKSKAVPTAKEATHPVTTDAPTV